MIDKSPENIKSLFNEIAQYYDKVNNFISLGTHYFIKFLALKTLEIKPRAMVLDICCGTGDFTQLVQKFYPRAKIIGIDRYKEIARKHNLFTKKWTYGRLKEFTKDINEELEEKLKKKKSIFSKLKRR